MLGKMEYYGIRGITSDLFRSYLPNGMQQTSIEEVSYRQQQIVYGMLQGLVVGPFLFLIFINELNKAVKYSIFHHFADKTNVLYSSKSIST